MNRTPRFAAEHPTPIGGPVPSHAPHRQRIMKRIAFVVAALLLLAGSAAASDYKVGALEIVQPWSRATPKGARVASGYVTIRNSGSTADRLIGATFAFASRAEIHEMSTAHGVMKMREIKALEIKPGTTVELKPGSYHLMFIGLTGPLAKGDRVKGALAFENAGAVEIEYAVEAIGAMPAGHGTAPAH